MESQRSDDSDKFYKHVLPRTCPLGMLFCGSFYEQPLEYAFLNLTDLDTMFIDRQIIAATDATVISKYFHGEILTIESENCHLAYARLLRRRGENTMPKYFKRSREHLDSPSVKKSIMTPRQVSDIISILLNFIPNLKTFRELTVDHVFSVICPDWPSEADEWRTRKRNSGWPTRNMIDKIVYGGCHLVPKSHQSNPNDDTCWRYSFSQAEFILLESWNEVQKYIYHILRILKSDVIGKCGGEKKTFLCTYYFKTLMMWACEEKPSNFWSEDRIEEDIKELLLKMIDWLIDKCCPNYFIRDNNMLDYLKGDVRSEVSLLRAALIDIPKVVSRHPKAYRGKMLHIRVSDKSLLFCQLAINRRFFVNPLDQTRGRYTVKDLSSSGLFRREVEHLLRAVQLHRLLMSDLPSSEAAICEKRKSNETKALGCFQKSCERKVTNNYRDVFISSLDSLSSIANKFLNGKPSEHSQRICCSRTIDEGKFTKEAMEALCQSLVSLLDKNHHNPSYFISVAYYANFYYTCLRDYRHALAICVKAIKDFNELKNVVGVNSIEEAFTNEMLCMFINSQYAGIYDAEIEVVFGFLTLCVATFLPNEKSSSDRNLFLHNLVFQMCPVEFLKYIEIRCINKLHPHESDRPIERHYFCETDTKQDIGGITDLKKLSNSILSTAIIVDSNVRWPERYYAAMVRRSFTAFLRDIYFTIVLFSA